MNKIATKDDAQGKIDIPPEYKDSVVLFFMFHSDILKGKLGLITRVQIWINDPDIQLRPEEAKRAMKLCMDPEAAANYEHVGKLMADLARRVREQVNIRKKREANSAIAQEEAEYFNELKNPEEARRLGEALKKMGQWRIKAGHNTQQICPSVHPHSPVIDNIFERLNQDLVASTTDEPASLAEKEIKCPATKSQ